MADNVVAEPTGAVQVWMHTEPHPLAVALAEALHEHHNVTRKWWQRRSKSPLQWWGMANFLVAHAAATTGRREDDRG